MVVVLVLHECMTDGRSDGHLLPSMAVSRLTTRSAVGALSVAVTVIRPGTGSRKGWKLLNPRERRPTALSLAAQETGEIEPAASVTFVSPILKYPTIM
jgi:hypothetical protein